jgi:hypothetical protein
MENFDLGKNVELGEFVGLLVDAKGVPLWSFGDILSTYVFIE